MSYDPFRNYRFTNNRKRYPNWFEYFDMMNADQDMERVMTGVLNSLREMTEPEPTHRVFKHVYTRTITANGRTFKVTVEELMEEEEASAESEDPESSPEDPSSEE
jgi:hypothetical protein